MMLPSVGGALANRDGSLRIDRTVVAIVEAQAVPVHGVRKVAPIHDPNEELGPLL